MVNVIENLPLQITQQNTSCCFCFVSLIIGSIIILILLRFSWIPYKLKNLILRRRTEEKSEGKRVEVKEKDIDYTQVSKKSRSKTSFLDKLLKKKKVCDECGTELEYREAYDSWYCPECHTYK